MRDLLLIALVVALLTAALLLRVRDRLNPPPALRCIVEDMEGWCVAWGRR